MKLVCEQNPETGEMDCELTGRWGTYRFRGKGSARLELIPGLTEYVDVSTHGLTERIPGETMPDAWGFTLCVDEIERVERETGS